MKYMIHAYPGRMWYVRQFLVPSMLEQGISEEDITIWNDKDEKGNLTAWLESIESIQDEPGGYWHLQDDVIISRQFAKLTREHDDGIVCGFFCRNFDLFSKPGEVPAHEQWYSFPCIRIPNVFIVPFRAWFERVKNMERYAPYYKENKHDDWFWKEYMRCECKGVTALNLTPNIVDHIDYLLGGTLVNKGRLMPVNRAAYFPDGDLVDALEAKLKCGT